MYIGFALVIINYSKEETEAQLVLWLALLWPVKKGEKFRVFNQEEVKKNLKKKLS